MKKDTLKQIIIEELEKLEADDTISEGVLDRIKARLAGAKGNIGAAASGLAGKALGALGAQNASAELQQASQSRAEQAKTAETQALLRSHAASVVKASAALQNAFAELGTDLQKIKATDPLVAKNVASLGRETADGMKKLVSFLQTGGQMPAQSAQQTSAPAAKPVSKPVEAPQEETPVAPKAPAVTHTPDEAVAKPSKTPREQKKPQAPEPKKPVVEPVQEPNQTQQNPRQRVGARARR